VGATLLAKHYGGETTIAGSNYLPQDAFRTLTAGMEELTAYHYASSLALQEAYGEYAAAGWRLRVGRQLHQVGVGKALRPTDLFNTSNPADPMWEPEGQDGIHLELPLLPRTRLEGFVQAGPRLAHSGGSARLSVTGPGSWRAAATFTRRWQSRIDWRALNTPAGVGAEATSGLEPFTRQFRWDLLAGELSGAVGGVNLRAEGGYAFVSAPAVTGTLGQAGRDHLRLMLGADHRFAFGLEALVEYMYLGQGRARASALDLNDRLALLNGEVQAIAAHGGYLSLAQDLPAGWNAGVRGQVAAITPANAALYPFVAWQPRQGISADLFGVLPLGSSRGAHGNLGPGLYLWLSFQLSVGAS
jgi:hypothetical protein